MNTNNHKMTRAQVLAKMERELRSAQECAENIGYPTLERDAKVEARTWQEAIELVRLMESGGE